MSSRPLACAESSDRPIAVVGLGCIYAGASNCLDFWNNVVNNISSLSLAPPSRIALPLFTDHSDTRRAGWIGDRLMLQTLADGLMPNILTASEPDTFLVLDAVRQAVVDSGCSQGTMDKRFTASIILGKGNYCGPKLGAIIYRHLVTPQVVEAIRELRPDLTDADLEKVRDALLAPVPQLSADSATGAIPNFSVGRTANRLGFHGTSATVDAACASSLIALEMGVNDLMTGNADIAFVGGVHLCSELDFAIFESIGALSPTGTIRPFDKSANGTVPGEGVGVLMLKRLSDAERDGNKIYALVRGIGTSTDTCTGLIAPSIEGQALALERAYSKAGCSPESVELLEAHGTGTTAGDAVELEVLSRFFPSGGRRSPCVVGSVKSLVGHSMPASGAAGLIKAVLSLFHGVLPPSTAADAPLDKIQSTSLCFSPVARPWIHDSCAGPRRAAVSAFGLGGVNAHAVLEEYRPSGGNNSHFADQRWEPDVVVLEEQTAPALLHRLQSVREWLTHNHITRLADIASAIDSNLVGLPCRISFVAFSGDDLREKLEMAIERLAVDSVSHLVDRRGIYYYGQSEIVSGKVAMIFPGLGSQYPNMLRELCLFFPEVRACFDKAASALSHDLEFPLHAAIYPICEHLSRSPQTGHVAATLDDFCMSNLALVIAEYALSQLLLGRFSIRPDMIMGYSSGEWIAMVSAGVFDIDSFWGQIIPNLCRTYGQLQAEGMLPTMSVFALVAAEAVVADLIRVCPYPVCITNVNCPRQTVVAVPQQDADHFAMHVASAGISSQELHMPWGQHTPAFEGASVHLASWLRTVPAKQPGLPLYSCTTGRLYESDADVVKSTLISSFSLPVRFQPTIEEMYEAGARIFLECGPRSLASAFVGDILQGKPHMSVSVEYPGLSGIRSLSHMVARLSAARVPFALARSCGNDTRTQKISERSIAVPLSWPRFGTIGAAVMPPTISCESEKNKMSYHDTFISDHCALMKSIVDTHREVMLRYMSDEDTKTAAAAESGDAAVTAESGAQVPEEKTDAHVAQESSDLAGLVLNAVSACTGYPTDALALDLDLEAGLGLDSLKRQEILQEIETALGRRAPEAVERARTLREVLASLQEP